MKGSFKLGKVAGIGIFIHWTFSLLIAYIIYSNYRAGNNKEEILWAIIFILSIFVTVFLHELGHALAAKKFNIHTKDITILPIGGLARLEQIPEKPKEELIVALAGPAVNILIAVITGFFVNFPDAENLTTQLSGQINNNNFFINFLFVNLWLAFFNLIPAFPMDGGRVLRALLSFRKPRYSATKVAARVGQFISVIFIVMGFYTNPFLIFIGLFIFVGAQAELEMTKTGSLLKELKVKDIIMTQYETIDQHETIEAAIKKLLNGQTKNFLVMSGTNPVGSLSRDEIIKGISDRGIQSLIHEAMTKELIHLDVEQHVKLAYQQMISKNHQMALVFDHKEFVGVLDIDNILEIIMIKGAFNQFDKSQ